MEFSSDKEQSQAHKPAEQDVIRYIDPATNRPRRLEPNSPIPERMRFAPSPRKIEDRE